MDDEKEPAQNSSGGPGVGKDQIMERKRRAPRKGAGQPTPAEPEGPRRGSPGIPGSDEAAAVPVEHSEDFGRRRDIETADEPTEEHDRRHHDEDAEVGRPV